MPPKITRIGRAENVISQKIGEETALMNPHPWRVHVLNDTASRIWELLSVPRTVDELKEIICGEFDVSSEDAGEAIAKHLAELEDKGLLTRHDG